MRLRYLLLPLLLVASAPSMAGRSVDKVRAQVVNSMSLSGTIEIDDHGRVMRYTIAHPEAYSQAVRDLVDRSVPRWTFNPVLVHGVATDVRADMYLRLQATPIEGDTYRIEVASVAFGGRSGKAGNAEAGITSLKIVKPDYPRDELFRTVGGTVVVVVRVDASGHVDQAAVEQTNLRTLGTESQIARWRRDFERETLAAVKKWTFNVPAGEDKEGSMARIPFTYVPGRASSETPLGHWESYIPGPRHRLPWIADEGTKETADAGIDALPGGGVFPVHQELQLLTPLNAG